MSAPNKTTPLKRPGIPTTTADLEARVLTLEQGVWPRTIKDGGFDQGPDVDEWKLTCPFGTDPTNWGIEAITAFYPQGNWDARPPIGSEEISFFSEVTGSNYGPYLGSNQGGLALCSIRVRALGGFTAGSGVVYELVPPSTYQLVPIQGGGWLQDANGGTGFHPIWANGNSDWRFLADFDSVTEVIVGPTTPFAWQEFDWILNGFFMCAGLFA